MGVFQKLFVGTNKKIIGSPDRLGTQSEVFDFIVVGGGESNAYLSSLDF